MMKKYIFNNQLILCSMSSLHIWFSKLKWSLDVLLRFYERHAFICALHKVSLLINCICIARVLTPHSLLRKPSFCLMSWYSACRGCIASPSTWTCPSTPAYLRRSPQLRWECSTIELMISISNLTFNVGVQETRALQWLCLHTDTNFWIRGEAHAKMTLLPNFLSFCLHNYMPVKCLKWRAVHFYVTCSECNAVMLIIASINSCHTFVTFRGHFK